MVLVAFERMWWIIPCSSTQAIIEANMCNHSLLRTLYCARLGAQQTGCKVSFMLRAQPQCQAKAVQSVPQTCTTLNTAQYRHAENSAEQTDPAFVLYGKVLHGWTSCCA